MGEVLRPLGGHSIFLLLIQLSLLLLVARAGAELCRRLSLPAVIGELAAGITLGPTVLGHFAPTVSMALFPRVNEQMHLLEVVGALGMVLLLLLTGLETDLRLLKNLGRAALIASAMGMLVPFVSGFGLGMFMPDSYLAQPDRRVLFSFFLATAMAISAMPVIAKILMDLDLTKRNIGLVILSAGVVDDTAGWLILSLIAGAASHGSVRLDEFGKTLFLTGGFVVACAFVIYPLGRGLMRVATRHFKSHDADLVALLVFTFLAAAATEWIGIHAVFGAFAVGTIFRQVPSLRPEMVHRLESFVFSVLAPVFFGIVGLRVNLWALGGGSMLLVVLGVACLGKLLGCTVGSIWGGLRFWEGLSIAVAMNARGAMELVVATIGLSLGILNQQMFSMIVLVAIVTSFMAPLGLRLTMRKVRMTEEEEKRILAEQSKGVFDPTRVRVLMPTAGGRNEQAAALIAASIAKRSAHRVELLRVKAPESFVDRLGRLFGMSPGAEKEASGTNGKHLADAGLTSEVRELKRPSASLAILQEARSGFDVVVMGASRHGAGLGGETLEEVVRAAPCHVVIVKAGTSVPPYQNLLVCYDGGVFSRVAVEFAARYAELSGAKLSLAMITDRPSALPSIGDAPTEVRAVAPGERPAGEGTLNRISPVFHTIELKPRLVEIPNDPFGASLLNEARSGQYDMVVVGCENRAVQNRLFFGRDNERLIREAAVTVAIVVPNVALLR
jgi:Kef-type K+ transport system membrane component KefB/nucleotide-binding universal stress UspA family protein